MKKTNKLLSNLFLRIFLSSRKKGLATSSDHLERLVAHKDDEDINRLWLRTEPVVTQLKNTYIIYEAARDFSRGETNRWQAVLDQERDVVRRINHKILVVFDEKSPNYFSIFPDGLSGLYRGSYEQRITQLGAFVEKLHTFPELADVYTEANIFYQLVLDTRKAQQDKGISLETASDNLNIILTEVAQMMFGNLGFLIYKFAKTPEKIQDYFDFALMRPRMKAKGEETEDEGETLTIPPAATRASAIAFSAVTKLSFYNSGDVALGIYTATDANAPVPADVHILQPDGELNITAVELGDAGNSILLVANNDATTEGELEITVME
jgi:hypothetical protein